MPAGSWQSPGSSAQACAGGADVDVALRGPCSSKAFTNVAPNQRKDAHMDHNDMPLVAKKRDKGFTLVELLIVIVILGILATVTVFAVRGLTSDAKTNACAQEKKSLETSVEAYFAKTGASTIAGADAAARAATIEAEGFTATSPMYSVNADGTLSVVSGNSNGCTA
jgi:general secretion pathway protein G